MNTIAEVIHFEYNTGLNKPWRNWEMQETTIRKMTASIVQFSYNALLQAKLCFSSEKEVLIYTHPIQALVEISLPCIGETVQIPRYMYRMYYPIITKRKCQEFTMYAQI